MHLKKFSTPINFVIFQACWFACVWGAANNLGWLGPALVPLAVPLQVYLLTDNHKAETIFVFICGITGILLETIFILGGVYNPSGQELSICPPWMAALWFHFAMVISISLSWLRGKHLLAAVLAGLLGPLAYWGGVKLGAITVADAVLRGYVPIAFLWAITYIHNRMILQIQN